MARNAPLRSWDVHDPYGRALRVYQPTASCRYLSATWYEPGIVAQQRTTLGTDRAAAFAWCDDKAERLRRAQRRARPDRPRSPGQTLLDEYLNLDNQPGWDSPATYSKNRHLASRFLPARLLALPCEHWSTEDLREIIVAAAREGSHKRSYLMSAKGMLSGLVRLGVELGYFDANQINVSAIRVPKTLGRQSGRPFGDLDQEPAEDLLTYVDRHQLPGIDRIHALADALAEPYGTMVRLAAYSGMRWGELAALRYSDVDRLARTVRVDRAVLEDASGKLRLRLPKNRRRRITLYPALIATDMDAVCLAAELRAAAGGSDLLFPTAKGSMLRRSNFGRRHLRPAQEKVGWAWTFHTLRHCAAVWMLYDQRFDLHDVADVLGHRDSSVTQRIYVQAREGVAERLAAQAS